MRESCSPLLHDAKRDSKHQSEVVSERLLDILIVTIFEVGVVNASLM